MKAANRATPITVLLVDDHDVVRAGLRAMLDKCATLHVVGEAGSVEEAVREGARLKPTVVVMDYRLPDGNGAEAGRRIHEACPDSHVLFLSAFGDPQDVAAAFAAGADGYLLKRIGKDALIRAIESVAAGQSVVYPGLTKAMLHHVQASPASGPSGDTNRLSPQEERILAFVAEGKTNRAIAEAMGLSEKTVKNYLSNVFLKLHIERRSQAAAIYAKRAKH